MSVEPAAQNLAIHEDATRQSDDAGELAAVDEGVDGFAGGPKDLGHLVGREEPGDL